MHPGKEYWLWRPLEVCQCYGIPYTGATTNVPHRFSQRIPKTVSRVHSNLSDPPAGRTISLARMLAVFVVTVYALMKKTATTQPSRPPYLFSHASLLFSFFFHLVVEVVTYSYVNPPLMLQYVCSTDGDRVR